MTGVDGALLIPVPPRLDPATAAAFLNALRAAEAHTAPVIVLVGAEGVFCRGLEIGRLDGRHDVSDLEVFATALLTLRRLPKIVIAAVDGVAMGGGVGLVAAADLVIATRESTFGLPESLIGMVPAAILPFLMERMRPQQCRLWALAPHSRSAAEAARAGLVDVLTTRAGLERRTQYWVRQFQRVHPTSIRHIKRLTAADDRELELSLRAGLALTGELLKDPAIAQRFREYE